MKIKKFKAADSHQGLRMIRDELGPDASILACYEVADGMEFVVTTDDVSALVTPPATRLKQVPAASRDRADLFPSALPLAASSLPLSPTSAQQGAHAPRQFSGAGPLDTPLSQSLRNRPSEQPLVTVAAVTAAPPPAAAQQTDMLVLKQELGSMRSLLERHLRRFNPATATIADEGRQRHRLTRLGLDDDLAQQLFPDLPAGVSDAAWQAALHQPLANALVVRDAPEAGVIALIGAAGAGKTSLICKLATRHVRSRGRDGIALVSTDTARIGAQEQLRVCARILQIPVHVAHDPETLTATLHGLRHHELVLIDTGGLSLRDAPGMARLHALLAAAGSAEVLLTLAADSDARVQRALVHACADLPVSGIALTRIDQAAGLGELLSLLIHRRLPLSWCSDGGRISDDLMPANAGHLAARALHLAADDDDEAPAAGAGLSEPWWPRQVAG